MENRNLIDKESFFLERQKQNIPQEENSSEELKNDIREMKKMLEEVLNTRSCEDNKNKNAHKEENYEINQPKMELKIDEDKYEEELRKMRIKLNTDIPKVTFVYIVLSSMAASFFAINLFLTMVKDIVLIHPFASFISLIGAIGLLVTALTSIKDWREFIKNEK